MNVSALTQAVITSELEVGAAAEWLAQLPATAGSVTHGAGGAGRPGRNRPERVEVDEALGRLVRAPVARHDLTTLVAGAWAHRDVCQRADGLYVELAAQTDHPLLSTDERLVRAWPAARAVL